MSFKLASPPCHPAAGPWRQKTNSTSGLHAVRVFFSQSQGIENFFVFSTIYSVTRLASELQDRKMSVLSHPSMHPCKRICDITGFEAPYYDPRTKLRYANAKVFGTVRSLPNEYVQKYLAMRNAAVVLKQIV